MFRVHRSFDLTPGKKNTTISVALIGAARLTVRYHDTIVAEYLEDSRTVILRDGGWETVSTGIVINTFLSQLPDFQHFKIVRRKKLNWITDGETTIPFSGSIELKTNAKLQALPPLRPRYPRLV